MSRTTDFLLNRSGRSQFGGSKSEEEEGLTAMRKQVEEEGELIKLFRLLPDKDKQALIEQARGWVQLLKKNKKEKR